MSAELLSGLIGATIASSAAIVLIGLLRKPLRMAVGARAAYWLWLLVPALVLASLLPGPAHTLIESSTSLPGQVRSALSAVAVAAAPRDSTLPAAGLAIWIAGACAMWMVLAKRQRSFTRSLGALTPDPEGFHRGAVPAPMLLGAWRPRIVVPLDFESRYSREERELVLAHERAHLSRRDFAANALASGWLCLSWFNPLAYWASGWLRTDQELACDARVLAALGTARHRYAKALLKAQLATESAWRMPVGCHWQSNHSLKERIVMLKRPLPGTSRQWVGIASILGLAAASGYAAWAGQPAAEYNGPKILVDMRVKVIDSKTNEVFAVATRYLVHSGELPSDMKVPPLQFACTPFLGDELARSPAWDAMKARGLPLPPTGYILLDCTIRRDGEVIATPAVMAMDGKPAKIETSDREGLHRYTIELSATTAEDRIAAANKAAAKR